MNEKCSSYDDVSRFGMEDPALPFFYVANKVLREIDSDERRWHEEIEVKYMISGQAEILCGPRVFIAQAGDVVVINSCEMHGIRQHGAEPVVYHLLMIPPDLPFGGRLAELIAPVFEGKSRFDNIVHDDRRLQEIILSMFECLERREAAYELEAGAQLALLFARLLRCHADRSMQPCMQKYAERLRPAIEYIYHHYNQDVRIEELARVCSLSVYYFCRMFKTGTGYTVSAYINNFRLGKAATLLRTTDLPVASVAALVGYHDECYFSRCFRSWAGMPPTMYREQRASRNLKEQDNASDAQDGSFL